MFWLLSVLDAEESAKQEFSATEAVGGCSLQIEEDKICLVRPYGRVSWQTKKCFGFLLGLVLVCFGFGLVCFPTASFLSSCFLWISIHLAPV